MDLPNPHLLLALYGAALVLFVFFYRRRLGPILGSVGRPAGYFVTTSIIILIVAQVYPPGNAAYPYASWAMYTSPTVPRTAWHFEVSRASGESGPLVIRSTVRGPSSRAVMRRLYALAAAIGGEDPDRAVETELELDPILRAMVHLDSIRRPADRLFARHPDPIRAVDLTACELVGTPPWSRSDWQCGPVLARWTFDPQDDDAPR